MIYDDNQITDRRRCVNSLEVEGREEGGREVREGGEGGREMREVREGYSGESRNW